ncbi:hypothetical protein [Enterobacter roggenkampii]|uniref:hypothetical protein n=1 Tax=Enterobacter roggenkampii TaxID=1812935 RepID=UPI000BA00FDC|nr:hypothetical protein [Enterobacter roggenkampii]OZU98685.1 hypothetical protein CIW59_01905 [Enterobacter roggenkampii]WFC89392.1 hypothetical protein OM420_12585 [Enterobacter roggenkampii]
MVLYVHSDCLFTRIGIEKLVERLFDASISDENVHVFDLTKNSHPVALVNRVKHIQYHSSDVVCKIVVICDEETALFLRRFNLMCITQNESVFSWVNLLFKLKGRKWGDTSNIWKLERYYERKAISAFDFFILDCRMKGFSFAEIAEVSGVSPKAIYSRYSQMKYNFKLNKANLYLIYEYMHALKALKDRELAS